MGYRQTPTKENHARVIKHLTCFRHLYLLLIARKVGFAQNRRRPAHLTSLDHLILQELQSWLMAGQTPCYQGSLHPLARSGGVANLHGKIGREVALLFTQHGTMGLQGPHGQCLPSTFSS